MLTRTPQPISQRWDSCEGIDEKIHMENVTKKEEDGEKSVWDTVFLS